MRSFPVDDPGRPDGRSSLRYLLWTARAQATTMAGGALFGVAWMLTQALMPATIGRAIDRGVIGGSTRDLLLWSGALLSLGIVQVVSGAMQHRFAVLNWLSAAFRTVQVTSRQAVRLGATLPKRLATGEVVSVGVADTSHIGRAMDITARGTGAVVSIALVGAILLTTSLPLGLIVLVGVPLLAAGIGPLLQPLHDRQRHQRDLQGELATRSADIVAGLRVLRGIGGEQAFARRYQEESQAVRAAALGVARVESLLQGAEILLPGLLVAVVTWLGARFAMAGAISVGQLVSFYGYAIFLVEPIRTLTEAADKITKAHVAARRVVRILSVEPEIDDRAAALRAQSFRTELLPTDGDLIDVTSGLIVRSGQLTAIAATAPEVAQAIADRLGRFSEDEVTWGGVPLRELPLRAVREAVLVADNEARLFSGLLRDELAGVHGAERVWAALRVACAEDLVHDLPGGLDTDLEEGGREFSGGQQQRLRLARALAADPEVLVLVEPTSAVDAHTEARIAERLAAYRRRRTTVVCTTSPLVLDHADEVAFVEGGRVTEVGPHRDLLVAAPRYAAAVTREDGT